MKKITLLAGVAFLLCSSAAMAQFNGGGNRDPQQMAQRMQQMKERQSKMFQDSLGVSQDIADSLASIESGFNSKTRELMFNKDLSREDKMAQAKTIQEQKEAAVKAYLAPDVYSKYQAFEANRKNQRRGGGFGGRRSQE